MHKENMTGGFQILVMK